MDKNVIPTKNAIIVDADFLNFITTDFKVNFERILGRQLRNIDLSLLFSYIAMDWGIAQGNNEIDIHITYSKGLKALNVCVPSSIADLNGMAFKGNLGEFTFHTYSNEGMVDSGSFFLDSLQSLIEERAIKKLAVIGYNEHYGEDIDKILSGSTGKITTKFAMAMSKDSANFSTQIIAYPIMMALGIKSEELK